jgi:uncharacterized protein YuzE
MNKKSKQKNRSLNEKNIHGVLELSLEEMREINGSGYRIITDENGKIIGIEIF